MASLAQQAAVASVQQGSKAFMVGSCPAHSLRCLAGSAAGNATVSSKLRMAAVVTKKVASVPKQKIRVKLRAFLVPELESACNQISDVVINSGASLVGPVRLPNNRRTYCVLRSPHVDKDSREHFEIRTHKRLIEIENPTAETIDALMQLDLPYGVDLRVSLV